MVQQFLLFPKKKGANDFLKEKSTIFAWLFLI